MGLVAVVAYLLMALFGPYLSAHSPYAQDIEHIAEGLSWQHPLGRDELGRDMLARIVLGSRYSLGMALTAVLLGGIAGIAFGVGAGFFGGLLEVVIMRMVDLMLAFPGLLVAIAISSARGPGFDNLIIAIAVASIAPFARLVRALVLSLKEEHFVTAARSLGGSDFHVILRHILPNCVPSILVLVTYSVSTAMLAASGLSFLGLGAQPPTPEWGVMLSHGRDYLRIAPHVVVIPGLAIAMAILAFNLVGDGLRDILDPRMVN